TTTCTDGMVVRTQLTSEVAEKAQRGVMELLLVNHPLDCPMCDKGGECPLQNQAMSTGQGETRFHGTKRTFAKPIALSAQVLLDRERCVQCARCTRFADQIAGDPLIELLDRGPPEHGGVAGAARSPGRWLATTRRSTRSGTVTRAAGPSPMPPSRTGLSRRWSATRLACWCPRPGRRRSTSPPAA